jgi:hypothetical protein
MNDIPDTELTDAYELAFGVDRMPEDEDALRHATSAPNAPDLRAVDRYRFDRYTEILSNRLDAHDETLTRVQQSLNNAMGDLAAMRLDMDGRYRKLHEQQGIAGTAITRVERAAMTTMQAAGMLNNEVQRIGARVEDLVWMLHSFVNLLADQQVDEAPKKAWTQVLEKWIVDYEKAMFPPQEVGLGTPELPDTDEEPTR